MFIRRHSVCLILFSLLGIVLPASGQLGKGNLLLISRGLQVQGMVTKDDVFHLSTLSNANYSSVNWFWEANPSSLGVAPGFPWSRWVLDETNMPPKNGEGPYISQLFSLQLADEWNLNDPTVRTRAVDWFNSVRSNYPNTILYANSYGGQVNDASLGDFITRAKPDMLCFDTYPWKSDYATRVPLAGPPTSWYSELRRYRQWGINSGLPFGAYRQTFHAVQDYDQTVYRDPSASELQLNTFGALAFNAKTLIDFTYNTGASSLFVSPGGDATPSPLYDQQADINRRARNLGKALVRLQPVADAVFADQHTTSMMFVRGKDATGSVNAIPVGFLADPQAPNSYTDWESDRNDPYLRGWVVTNTGTMNNNQPGDVILSWFKPLDESFDGPDYTNQLYMMVVNGLTATNGMAADCSQQVKLNFLNTTTTASVILLDPATGQLQTNALPVVSTRRQLTLNLTGGEAALFKFNTGAPFAGFYPTPQPKLRIQKQAGSSLITVEGLVAANHRIERANSLASTGWTSMTNLLLPISPYVYQDADTVGSSQRFYRALVTY